jgi:transcriptional regulator with XRE-family HTH domain
VKLLSNIALISKLLTNKAFRNGYVYEHVKNGIPFQIRALREERQWTQEKLGDASEKPRNVISRLEDPNYGNFTLKTLLEIASAFEVALLVKFVPFSRLLEEYEDTSVEALGVKSITQEKKKLMRWAQIRDRIGVDINSNATTERQASLPFITTAAANKSNVVPFPSHTVVYDAKTYVIGTGTALAR